MRAAPRALGAVALFVGLLAMPADAGAAADTLTVNSTADPGDGNCATGGCTLREAITQLDDGDTDATGSTSSGTCAACSNETESCRCASPARSVTPADEGGS